MKSLLLIALLATVSTAHADYSDHPRAAKLTTLLADEYGFDDDDLTIVRGALASARKVPKLIEAEKNAKEKTLTWTRYRPIHVNDSNIRNGAAFMREHRELLERARAKHGVPPQIISAILGVETKWGGYTGPHRVLDSLATQGFDHPTRHRFFLRELAEFFAFCREYEREPGAIVGSYAGAMGMAQFMPSNYRRHAVDFDDDGDIDLWSTADAIGSIANYLVHYRPSVSWRAGEPIAIPAQVTTAPSEKIDINSRKPASSIAELADRGIRPQVPLAGDLPASLLRLDLDSGREYWLGMNNFYSIMSYNPRVFYAMSVAQLADEIALAAADDAG